MEHAERLRQEIAVYRQYLAEGVEAAFAVKYLCEIKRLRSELAEISGLKPASYPSGKDG